MIAAEIRVEKHPKFKRDREDDDTVDSPESWARQLRRGDPQAVLEVRQRVSKILAHGSLAIPLQERDDLEQEITMQVWQAVNRPQFDFFSGFWGFVEVVASRRCIDWLRSRRTTLEIPDAMTSNRPGPLGATLRAERRGRVEEVLAQLAPSCRDLILARLRDELSYEAIARKTGKTKGALRVQLYRCIQRARTLLANGQES